MRVRPRASSSPPVRAQPPPIPRHARPKTTIPTEQFGPYLVFESMGEGGMACVHRAERAGADGFRKPVALKRMWAHLSDDRDFVEAFVQEARLVASLRHDHIAQAYECGTLDGTYYIAMELVPGPTLNELMIQSRTAAGPIPLPIIVELLIQLCDALEHAHAANIIHRDVSPANVIVSTAGSIKLIDFGIAKAAHSRVQTQAGFIKGKLGYVAPEYTLGLLDHRADLFAVGVIAHELLTGRRLFLAESDVAIVHNVREKPIVPPSRSNPEIGHDLDDIVMTALQRDPARRWQNAAAMRTALVQAARQIGPASGKQIRDWVEWAFTREPWRDSLVERLVDKLETTRPRHGRPIPRESKVIIEPELVPRAATPTYREPPPLLVLDLSAPVVLDDATVPLRKPRDSAPTIVDDVALHLEISRPAPVRLAAPTQRLNVGSRAAPWLVLLVIALAIGAAAWSGWLVPALSAI